MVEAANVLKFLMCYTLCAIYSGWIAFGILIAYIFKRDTKFWEVKARPVAPRSLTSNEYGEHKFMTVNVSETAIRSFLTQTQQVFSSQGIKIHYVEKGDPKKKLMIFVHGFPEFWYSWRYQLKEFSKDYHVIAIDQRGYAESDKPTSISDYHIDKMVGDLRQFVKQLGKSD